MHEAEALIWKCQTNVGACCSVAAVVFLGYIGSCFLAVAIVLKRDLLSSSRYSRAGEKENATRANLDLDDNSSSAYIINLTTGIVMG